MHLKSPNNKKKKFNFLLLLAAVRCQFSNKSTRTIICSTESINFVLPLTLLDSLSHSLPVYNTNENENEMLMHANCVE